MKKRKRTYDFDADIDARIKAANNKRCPVCRSVLPASHEGRCLVCHQLPPKRSWLSRLACFLRGSAG